MCLAGAAQSQPVDVKGYFLEDSVLLGSPASYVLVARYPGSVKVVFPDSTHNYAPFEYRGKLFFPSRLVNGVVVDSVVYQLATFELDPYQSVALPVYQLRQKDSLRVTATPDSVLIAGLLREVPPDAPLKESVDYNALDFAFNYPYLVAGVVIFIILAITLFLVFGKTVKKKIMLYRMRKKYERFSAEFTERLRKLRASTDLKEAESAFISWKSYLESLEKIPYTKLTTKEILKGENNERLKVALKHIDRNIYGKLPDDQLFKQFETLEDISLDKYKKKIAEVNHG